MSSGIWGVLNCSSHKFGLPVFLSLFRPFLFQVMIVIDLKGNIYQLSFVG
jgi:hypothetical protein